MHFLILWSIVTFSFLVVAFSVGNWTFVLPSPVGQETPLHLVSDMYSMTCADLSSNGEDLLLRGHFTRTYNSLLVTVTMSTSVAFGPGPGQPTCHPMSSSLLTHQRSDCNQIFCDIPTPCRYLGNTTVSTILTQWQYDFLCLCGQPVCNELLLWFHRDSVMGQLNMVSICEVDVRHLWIQYQFHD